MDPETSSRAEDSDEKEAIGESDENAVGESDENAVGESDETRVGESDEPEVEHDTGPLEYLLGPPARTRIVEAFVAERGRDLTVSDVARLADVARSTVYRHIDDLEAIGVVAHARDGRAGHSPRYELNDDSEIAQLLYELEGVTLQRLLEVEGHLAE